MSTYSISQGITYAEKLPNFQSILNVLPDNTQKLIAPRDVRDAIFTAWENISMKITQTPTSGEYIGIDQDFIQNKFYFGKKVSLNEYVITSDLLNEDIDHYFYNSRPDTEFFNTKIAILSGTAGDFYFEGGLRGSFIESKVVTGLLDSYYSNLEIRNTSYALLSNGERVGGDINLISDKGYISLNGFSFPRLSENNSQYNDGKFLKFIWDGIGNGYATWSNVGAVDSIVSAGTVSITGSPVLINGRNINFTDPNPIPETFGGILAGEVLTDVPVTEVLRKLLYPYLAPIITSNFLYEFIESGDTTSSTNQKLNYTIFRPGTFSVSTFTMNPSGGSLIAPNTIVQNTTGISNFTIPTFTGNDSIFLSTGVMNKTITRTLSVIDNKPTTATSSSQFQVVIPWFYGISTTAVSSASGINAILGGQTFQLNKLTALLKSAPQSGEVVTTTLTSLNLPSGKGCIYFGYPSTYPQLTEIKDDNDFDITTSFTEYTVTGINSPLSRWNNISFRFYIYTQVPSGTPSLTTVPNLSQFKFKF
jgi:hypothetical protein